MSAELLVDLGEDALAPELDRLKLSPLEDQKWPPDALAMSNSGNAHTYTHVHNYTHAHTHADPTSL